MQNKIDFSFLRTPLIGLLIAILLSAGLIFGGAQFEQEKVEQYNQVKGSLQKAHRKYTKLVKDIDLLDQYTKAYKAYKSTGLVGPERRLSWIETLETVNDELRLPKLSYKLEPQQEFVKPGLKIERNILVASTPMTLTMDLLHEEDLLDVFDGIRENIDNLFTVESCSIKRKGGAQAKTLSTKKENLSANCLIRWITVDVQK